MSPSRPIKHPELGAALRRARKHAGLSGPALVARLGWSTQAKVSLIESGRQTPAEDEVRAWAEATSADTAPLLAELDRALTRHLDIRAAARRAGGIVALQGDLAQLEAASTAVAEYQAQVIPGLAQTEGYTRAWLAYPGRLELGGELDVDSIVAKRLERQRQVRDGVRRITIVVEPAALAARFGSRAVHREQLDTLATDATAGAIELVVTRRPEPIIGGFELLDDAVAFESPDGMRIHTGPGVVAKATDVMFRLRGQGLTGRAAVRAIRDVRGRLS